ncbi:disrupted in renal carcinoma protein 2 homolog [Melanaphis sacchari]|uniref:disrupted in renal carcinoma protein 2 homolog n=1 Tax=Melanaphis sacchari TaxID=742174 RepID=UPI000DC13A74|nr:disrupted in renal carcinoma protein 2 homolog [Melanaphis sacchari]
MPSNFYKLGAPTEFTTQCSFFMIIHAFILSLAFSKFADRAPNYKKIFMLGCHCISTFSIFWLMMMFGFKTKLTLTVLECVVLIAFPYTWGCQPLFYEMGAELTYPLPESFIAGYMTVANNVFIDFVYVALYFFPHFGNA